MTNPVVSIVLPTFNRLRWLPTAVASIQAQWRTGEVIVVDDGSTDGTERWAGWLSEPRVRYVRHVHRGNIAAVRNIGLDAARGEWIAFLDSDDRWRPRKLVLQIERLACARISLHWRGAPFVMPLPVNCASDAFALARLMCRAS